MGEVSVTVFWHQLLGALLLPPLLGLWPVLLGAACLRRRPGAGRGLLALGVLLIYGLSIPQTAIWLGQALERYPVLPAAQLAQVDAIVVLGGGKRPAPEYGAEQLSADSLARLRYAAHLARQSGKPLLLSGGAPLGGEPEARVMARVLRDDYQLTPRWLEDKSNTTLENARLSAPLLRASGVGRIALVSQNWHLARALPLFQRQGLQVSAAPTSFTRYDGGGVLWLIPSGRAMQECHAFVRELIGRAFYALKGE